MSREVMRQALNALVYHTQQTRPIQKTELAIEALRAELAKPEPISLEMIKAMRQKYPTEDLCIWSYNMGIADAENFMTGAKP